MEPPPFTHAKYMTNRIDYNVINPSNKWRMLRVQWRYGLWGE